MGNSLQNKANIAWLNRILKRANDEGLIEAKQIAEFVGVNRSTVYAWFDSSFSPSVDLLADIYEKFPSAVVDCIDAHLQSLRPARDESDDDINGDGRIDGRDVHDHLLLVAQLDLKARLEEHTSDLQSRG